MASKKDDYNKQQHGLHDSLFKQIFKQKRYFKDLLCIILPSEALPYLDLENVDVHDGELIKSDGKQLRADLVATVGLKKKVHSQNQDISIKITFIFEHKSYRDLRGRLQVMGYFVELAKQSLSKGHIIVPVIFLCCKDKKYEPPANYLATVFADKKIPKIAKILEPWLPKLFGRVVNVHDLVRNKTWTESTALAMILYGMSEVWTADGATVADLVDKAHRLEHDEAKDLILTLRDYYTHADNSVDGSDFERIERERYPDVKEEDHIMQKYYFGPERYKREGMEQGRKEGIEQGIEQGKMEMVKRFLLKGVDEQIICSAAQISKKELIKIKRSLLRV